MEQKKTYLMYIVITVVVCASAYFLGLQVADAMISSKQEQSAEEFYKGREKFTQEALSYLKGLSPGDTVPDHRFEDIKRESFQLSDLVNGPTAITFFDTECESCRTEMKEVSDIVRNNIEHNNFIFISASNPRLIEELVMAYSPQVPVLYDHRGAFILGFELHNFPFTIIVDKNLVVQEAIAAPLTSYDIKRIASL